MSNYEGHTPGPWFCKNEVVVSKDGVWIKPYHRDSWEGNRKWPSSKEQDVNARLIAAAPDLLAQRDQLREALELAVVELEHAGCRDNQEHTLCLRCRALELSKKALRNTGGQDDET